MESDLSKMLKKNEQLNQLDMAKVASHVQREADDWVHNTIMLEDYDVPFKYLRKKLYKNLKGRSCKYHLLPTHGGHRRNGV